VVVLTAPADGVPAEVLEIAAGLWHLDHRSELNSPIGCLAAATRLSQNR
jgi:hypothetical protein